MTSSGYDLAIFEGLLTGLDPSFEEQFQALDGPDRYPFLQLAWLRAFEHTKAVSERSGWIPRHIAIWRGGQLMAFAPGYIKLHSFGEFVFDQGWAQCSEHQLGVPYYPKYVIGIPFTPTTGPRLLMRRDLSAETRAEIIELFAATVSELCEQFQLSSAHILFCEHDLATSLCAFGFTQRLGVQYQFHNPKFSTFDDFLSTFRAKKRANIRRERREVKKRGIEIEIRTGATLKATDARLAYELYLTTVDKYVWGRRYLNQEFFDCVFRDLPHAIHFVTAVNANKQVVAGAFNLIGADALYGRYWGSFIQEPFLHFEVCLYSAIQDTIERGLTRFEAGAGGEHKHGRGLAPTVTRSVHFIREPTLSKLVADFCAREAEQVQELIESERMLSCESD